MLGFSPLASAPLADDGGAINLIQQGSVSLSAAGSQTSVASKILNSLADLLAEGTIAVTGQTTLVLVADLSADSNVTSTATTTLTTSTNLIGNGSVSFTGTATLSLAANFNGSGSVNADARILKEVSTSLNANGTLTTTPIKILNGEFFSSVDNFTRITEAGDRRVTEDGTVRITDDVPFNAGQATIISFGDRVPFSAEPYVKVLSNWQQFTPYVKYEDNWQVPDRIYKNLNGNWKRIF